MTLTHLVLKNYKKVPITVNGTTDDAFNFLRNFDNLTHLEAANEYRFHGDLKIYDFSKVFPKLHSLKVDSRYSIIFDNHLNTVLDGLNSKQEKEILKLINKNLQELDIHLPTLSSRYIDLITTIYSPAQLKRLSITLYFIDMYDWMEKVGWENVLKLAQHLRLIPNSSIEFKAYFDYNTSSPRQESRMTKFYKLVGAITINRPNLYYKIIY